jgi:hypothetical protein
MRILWVLGLCTALGGCFESPGFPTLPNLLGPSKEVLAARDDEVCRGYGAKPGTDVYVQCRMAQVQHRDAADSGGDVTVVNNSTAGAPPTLHNMLPPTVRCQTAGTQTVCR